MVTGIVHHYSVLKYCGAISLLGAAILGCRAKRPTPPPLLWQIDETSRHKEVRNHIRVIVLSSDPNPQKVEALQRYLQHDIAELICQQRMYSSVIQPLLDAFLQLLQDDDATSAQVRELQKWVASSTLDWRDYLGKEQELSFEKLSWIPSADIEQIATCAADHHPNTDSHVKALKLLMRIAELQKENATRLPTKTPFDTIDYNHPAHCQANSNAYFQLGLYYLSVERDLTKAKDSLIMSICPIGFKKPEAIQNLNTGLSAEEERR